jgi:hypothetical protein
MYGSRIELAYLIWGIGEYGHNEGSSTEQFYHFMPVFVEICIAG